MREGGTRASLWFGLENYRTEVKPKGGQIIVLRIQ